ncbi:MAG: RNA polymerase sigma factor [Opitutaceae bacterium]
MKGHESFRQLAEAHDDALYRFALSLSKRGADASDLTQHAFLCWAQKGDALRDANAAKAWLFTTLHREFLRVHRRGRRFVAIEGQLAAATWEDAWFAYSLVTTAGLDALRQRL